MSHPADPRAAFIDAACVPLDAAHASGTLERANALLVAHPDLVAGDIHTAAILGDAPAVRRFLAADPASGVAPGGPRAWDALTHLCFSRYLRLDPARSDGFVAAARALLDAGASPNTGWWEAGHQPRPAWESVLYGAAGIAHHAALTRLLLERGADPNDGEVTYHTPETYDNGALEALVESGRLTADSLATLLLRKHDWHDARGVRYLLEHGADPNRPTSWGATPFLHAVRRDNATEIITAALEHGADPALEVAGVSAASLAARRGRGDLLALFERRGVRVELRGADRLLAACARDDAGAVRALAAGQPELLQELRNDGGRALAEFAGVGNAAGVGLLLDLGVPPDAPFAEGDGYWDVAPRSTALHVAAWRARHATVKLLLERGAPVDLADGRGRTPLALAVRACVDSYWTTSRSPESVRLLLAAGASIEGVSWPSGYGEVDALLAAHRPAP